MLICVISIENAYLCAMKEYRLTDWLPTTKKEVEVRGWDELDVILFSGDAYVDHPSFGAAVIGRILEAEGLRVAIVPQPNWRDDLRDFKPIPPTPVRTCGRSIPPLSIHRS